ncbi:ubiquitin-conjugating enzyme [Beauveria brongniartii RCEF 3172]|uniref:Ubiquitin-conjugating enzyme n=1 Tax=Beauveria brongniartii RCEF 3172 TaxID=1081107 RepID=A0A167HUZ2_9HYPO|nr:ubiquitin-conjugating enzyme [Beauveria brongniartii RCEF 3172]
MARTQFIPARDSRHRAAVLALYRALAKTATKVPLQGHIGDSLAHSSPIRAVLRRRFEKNSSDTSPRLVFAALTAGYKFLSFLHKSQNASSAEYRQIVRYLSSRKEIPTQQAGAPATKPAERKEPLLIKISGPGEAAKYTSNLYPRPLNSLTRTRRVPMMATTAEGLPFLRTSFVQPHEMSRMVGRKNSIFQSNIAKITEIQDELLPDAETEDEWERIVARQLRKERLPHETPVVDETYTWSLHLSRLWLEWKIESIWQDWIARGEAMQQIVDTEQRLADEEAGKTCKPAPTTPEYARPPSAGNISARESTSRVLPTLPGETTGMDGHDIFATPAWAAHVRLKHNSMRAWAVQPRGNKAQPV